MKNRVKVLSALALSALLAGCVSSPTKEQRWAKFRIYDQNQVGIKVVGNYGLKGGIWAWVDKNNNDQIIAIETLGGVYNAKDVASISSGKNQDALRIVFRDRTEESVSRNGLKFLTCNRKSECTYGPEIGGTRSLNIAHSYDNLKPEIRRDLHLESFTKYSGTPTNITFFVESEYTAFMNSIEGENKQGIAAAEEASRKLAAQRAREQAAAEERERMIIAEANSMRGSVRIGTRTNCGEVFDVRLPMVGVQTTVGTQFIRLDDLYGPSAGCRFVNGRYVGR
jgi:hypothetical protein